MARVLLLLSLATVGAYAQSTCANDCIGRVTVAQGRWMDESHGKARVEVDYVIHRDSSFRNEHPRKQDKLVLLLHDKRRDPIEIICASDRTACASAQRVIPRGPIDLSHFHDVVYSTLSVEEFFRQLVVAATRGTEEPDDIVLALSADGSADVSGTWRGRSVNKTYLRACPAENFDLCIKSPPLFGELATPENAWRLRGLKPGRYWLVAYWKKEQRLQMRDATKALVIVAEDDQGPKGYERLNATINETWRELRSELGGTASENLRTFRRALMWSFWSRE